MRQGAIRQVRKWDEHTRKLHPKRPLETTSLNQLFQEIEESEFDELEDLAEKERNAVLRFTHFGF